jgi:hypothetical protein
VDWEDEDECGGVHLQSRTGDEILTLSARREIDVKCCPDHVLGLILCNITAGPHAARALARSYYQQYLPILRATVDGRVPEVGEDEASAENTYGGLVPVGELSKHDLYWGLIRRRRANAEALAQTPAADLACALEGWAAFLLEGDGAPVVGTAARSMQRRLREMVWGVSGGVGGVSRPLREMASETPPTI